MVKVPQRTIVFGVNDPVSRIGWVLLAFLCVYGAVKSVRMMKIEMTEDLVSSNYMGTAAVSLYVIIVFNSIFSKAPSPVYRAHRWVRTIVPLILFIIIYFTIYNFQTIPVSVLVLSIVFGLFVLVQLVFPVEGFYFLYVVAIMILGGFLAIYAYEYDPKIQPFWFCFLTLLMFEMIIYFFNYPGETNRAFSFY